MKNILCVHQGYELYGSDRVFIQSLMALRQRWPACRLTVHLPQAGPLSDAITDLADEVVFGGMSVLRRKTFRPQSPWRFLKHCLAHRRLVLGRDLIYLNSAVLVSYIAAGIFCRGRYMLHIHEIPTGPIRIYFRMIGYLPRLKLVANSVATKNAVSEKCVVLYNGVADKPIDRNKTDRVCNLLLIGRLNGWKGQEVAIDAMRPFKNTEMRLRIVGGYFAGHAHYLTALREQVRRLGLENQVEFHDFTDDPTRFYQQADLVLVPSTRPEPFGLVAIEAMNVGLPVIASDHGGLAEIVRHQETGMLVKPGCADSLADAINAYRTQPQMAAKHGETGHARFQSHFTEAVYRQNFIDLVANDAA